MIARANELRDTASPTAALSAWLEAMIGYVTTYNGLSKSLAASLVTTDTELGCTCRALGAAGNMLLGRAQQAGELRPDAEFDDLMLGVHAAAWAAEQTDEPAAAPRLLAMLIDGLRVRAAPRAASPKRARRRGASPRRSRRAALR